MRPLIIATGIGLMFFGTMFLIAIAQPYGDGWQCYSYVIDDCQGDEWDYQGFYNVICCCGSGGPGSQGNECICRVDEWFDIYGNTCYQNNCGQANGPACIKGPSFPNVRLVTKV